MVRARRLGRLGDLVNALGHGPPDDRDWRGAGRTAPLELLLLGCHCRTRNCHGHAPVFMESLGNRTVIRSQRLSHRTLRRLRNPFTMNNLQERKDSRNVFRS